MSDASGGLPAAGLAELTGARWVKSSYSGPTGGNCVEVAFLADGQVAVRNSRHPSGPALVFSPGEWDAFIGGVRDGQFGWPAAGPPGR
jgi:uncharacterized protein DUF397